MIKEISVTNIGTGEQIEIGTEVPYFLESIDWGNVEVKQTSYRVPFQIGQFQTGETVGTRDITITGYVLADNVVSDGKTWKQYFDDCEEKINENKLVLDKIFSVYYNVLIRTGEYIIEGRPTTSVKYSTKEKENNEVLCLFSVVLKCFNPMFKKGTKKTELATTQEAIHFPLIIKEKNNIFGEILRRRSVSITNDGNVESGCKITISADAGIVKNPKIYIIQTEEYIQIEDVELQIGDYIVITTETGEENVILHDASERTETSIIGKVTNGSKYLKVKRGTYDYAYSVDEQYQTNIGVTIEFKEQFFNIKGM